MSDKVDEMSRWMDTEISCLVRIRERWFKENPDAKREIDLEIECLRRIRSRMDPVWYDESVARIPYVKGDL